MHCSDLSCAPPFTVILCWKMYFSVSKYCRYSTQNCRLSGLPTTIYNKACTHCWAAWENCCNKLWCFSAFDVGSTVVWVVWLMSNVAVLSYNVRVIRLAAMTMCRRIINAVCLGYCMLYSLRKCYILLVSMIVLMLSWIVHTMWGFSKVETSLYWEFPWASNVNGNR